jgi:WD40 repeat protein
MSQDLLNSAVLVRSGNPEIDKFGTGFVIHRDEQAALVLTCAHVVQDVGGSETVKVGDVTATVVALGTDDGIDLAVLHVSGLQDKQPLSLSTSGEKGKSFITAGFQFVGKQFLFRPLQGVLGQQVGVGANLIRAWDLQITDPYQLQPGYSGSPVVDEESGTAIGVVSTRQGEGKKGLAISVEALKKIWQEMPTSVFKGTYDRFSLPEEPAPYRGLLSFTEHEAQFFFGRDTERRRLEERLRKAFFTAVIGASGSGKSSLVLAGLLPSLENAWRTMILVPGARPLRALSDQLATLAPSPERLDLADKLADRFVQRSDGLGTAISALLASRRDITTLLLIIDQFEEIFTQVRGPQDEVRQLQRAFITNLVDAVQTLNGRLRVVMTLRADFTMYCLEFAELRELLEPNQFLIGPLDQASLREVIIKPAEMVGVQFEKGLVERIMDDMTNQSFALPLLQVALWQLWQRRQGVWLTHEDYEAIGRLGGAINQRADEIYADLSDAQKQLARSLFLRLVTLGEGTIDTRRRMPRDELALMSATPEEIIRLIDIFTRARLITTDADTIELAHEALIEQWGQLRIWLQENRADLLTQRRLTEAAHEWQRHNQEESYLYGGARLKEAVEWAKTHDQETSKLERAFLEASNTNEQAEIAEEEQYNSIREQLLAELPRARAAEALFELEHNPEQAMLIALAATHISATAPSSRVLQALYSVFDSSYIISIYRGHADRISSVEWSPDGQRILTGSYDGTAHIWGISAGTVTVLSGHTNPITSVAWSLDGQRILTGSWDMTARVWNLETGSTVIALQGHTEMVSSVSWSPDGQFAATGSQDRTACIWNVETGEAVQKLIGHQEWVRSAEWSLDGQQILTGSYDGTARLWDVKTGKTLHELIGHTKAVPSVDWSPDGKQALTASEDGTVRIWDTAKWETVRTLQVHTSHVYVGKWSPDGQRILTGGEDGNVRIWDAATGTRLDTFSGHTGWVSSVGWSPDGKKVVSGSEDMTARVWNADIRSEVNVIQRYTGWVYPAIWSSDGKQILICEGGSSIHMWDLETGEEKYSISKENISSVAWSSDEKMLLIGYWDGVVIILEVMTRTIVATLKGHTDVIQSVAWNFDDSLVLSSSRDGSARIWDVKTKANLHILPHTSWVQSAAWRPDSQMVATGCWDNTARLWAADTGNEVRVLNGHTSALHSVAWSPDGLQVLTSSGDGTVRIWNAATGAEVCNMRAGEVHSVAWSPDGRLVLTGGQDGTVRIWDANTGIQVRTLSHAGAVYSVAWSPDSNLILTSGEDGTVRVWVARSSLIIAEITRKVCSLLSNEDIIKEIPTWQGCGIEMAKVESDLCVYDALVLTTSDIRSK